MEHLVILFCSLLFPPICVIVILVTILSIFGKSLGIRRAYVRLLLRIFEWASRRIHKASTKPPLHVKAKGKIIDRESFEFDEDISATLNSEEEDVGGKSSSSNHELDDKKYSPSNFDGGVNVEVQKKNRTDSRHHSLIRRDAAERMLRKVALVDAKQDANGKMIYRDEELREVWTVINDSLDFMKASMEAIIEDEVTSRFMAEELPSWNLLTRSSYNYQYIGLRLTLIWCVGFAYRYFCLLPCRLMLLGIGQIWLVTSTAIIGCLPDGRLKRFLNWHISLMCNRILSRCVSAIITYHNSENRAKSGGICVANHTSPIDCVVLASDSCYAFVGQSHGGLLGVFQRALNRASAHIWFERDEANDRAAVAKRLKDHVEHPDKLPILIFPEGTCINNTSVMMFKKGSFEIGSTIYPVAIKYDSRFGDPFWNSSEQTWFQYLIRMMTSWAIVCDVWYLPPMHRLESESAVDFANRVKSKIAEAGGLIDLEWDGQLKRNPVKQELKEMAKLKYSQKMRQVSHATLPSLPAEFVNANLNEKKRD